MPLSNSWELLPLCEIDISIENRKISVEYCAYCAEKGANGNSNRVGHKHLEPAVAHLRQE